MSEPATPLKLIEQEYVLPLGNTIPDELTNPILANAIVRVRFETQAHSYGDGPVIKLSKFSQGTEFTVRRTKDDGLAISARDPKTNAIFEFVYNDHFKGSGKGAEKILIENTDRSISTIYLENVVSSTAPDGTPVFLTDHTKRDIGSVKDRFKSAIESQGFKFYEADSTIDDLKKSQASVSPTVLPGGNKKQFLA